ncbi:MAG: glycogen synthase [Longilinea sp.]|nr:glycogen synthase [Longilinea sp.]MCA1954274.1 glycogen synthase [Anaerolinea sp.]
MSADANLKTLRILMIASEADPLVKVGGLGDVAGSLPQALRALPAEKIGGFTLDVRLAIPFHSVIRQKLPSPLPVASFSVPTPAGEIPGQVYLTRIGNTPVYLIEGAPIPPDAPVYNTTNPQQDAEKYLFFSLACLEAMRALNWQPDILHANDWHTALAVYQLHNIRQRDPFFKHTRSLLAIHNLPFLGGSAEKTLPAFGFQPSQDKRLPDWARSFPLPLGLSVADHIVAVSPNYAREILTPAFGCGLQDFLRTRINSISGILNGLDQTLWDPANDTLIDHRFSLATLSDRVQNKLALQEQLELPRDPNIPLLIAIGRMDQQKGMDIAIEGLQMVTDQPWQMVFLGTGDPLLESACRSLQAEFPDRVRAVIRFDLALSHRMYASGDILLMPSRYEPCGLAQMIAMRYGCIPVARDTGGLHDTIQDTRQPNQNTGFLFKDPLPSSFSVALLRALALYHNHSAWNALQIRCMQQDFSWTQSAIAYANIYFKLMEETQ